MNNNNVKVCFKTDKILKEIKKDMAFAGKEVAKAIINNPDFTSRTEKLKANLKTKPNKYNTDEALPLLQAEEPDASLVEYGYVQVSKSGKVLGYTQGSYFALKAKNLVEGKIKSEKFLKDKY